MKSIKIASSKTNRKKQIILKFEKKLKSTKPVKTPEKRAALNPATRRKTEVSLRKLMKLRGEENE